MSTEVSIGLFCGSSSESTVPAGRAAKALLFGANTVKGPAPLRVSTRPAALTAATSVVWSAEFTAFWMMFLFANIGAPPTIGLAARVGPGDTDEKGGGGGSPDEVVHDLSLLFLQPRIPGGS